MKPRRILVIEDNAISQRLIRMTLAPAGFTIVEAADAKTALASAREATPDLVLMDLGLPDMDGLELLRRLREIPGVASLPVLAVSGYVEKLEQARRGGAGFADILTKPFVPDMLLRAVEAHIPRLDTASSPGSARRVVVADDDPVQLRLLTRRLENLGFLVAPVEDGKKALEEIRRSTPAAVIADVLMPQPDGFRLCHLIRQDPALSGLPVVLATSSYVEAEDHRLGESVGANAFVQRTPGFEAVINALLAALGGEAPRASRTDHALEQEYSQRIVRQLERRASLNIDLSRRCSLQAAELAVLTGISESLTKQVAPNLGPVLEQCLDAGGVSAGAIFEIKEGRLVKAASVGLSEAKVDRLGERLAARLDETFQHDGPTTIATGTPPGDELRRILGEESVATLVILPLAAQQERLGLLALLSRSTSAVSQDWLTFVRNVASQLGQALALARSFLAVADSEGRFRQLAENIDEVFWLTDPPVSKTLYVSPAYERLWQRSCASVYERPQSFIEGIHAEDRPAVMEGMQRDLPKGRFDVTYRVVRPDGTQRWVHARGFAVRDATGAIVRTAGIAADVTEIKESGRLASFTSDVGLAIARALDIKDAMRRCTEAAVAHLDAALAMVWELDEKQNTLKLKASSGLSTHGPLGKLAIDRIGATREPHVTNDVLHDPDVDRDWARGEGLVAFAGYPLLFHGKLVGVFALFSRRPLHDRALEAMRTAGDVIAVALRRKQEEREKEALAALAVRLAAFERDAGVAQVDGDETVALQRCTEAAVRHLGVALARIWQRDPRKNLLEVRASSGISPDAGVLKLDVRRIAETKQSHVTNDLVNDPELLDPEWARREGLVSGSGHPLLVGGQAVGVMTMYGREPLDEQTVHALERAAQVVALGLERRQSEQTRASLESQLLRAQKMEAVGRLAGGVAHDFNNLLTAIMGYSNMIIDSLRRDDPLRRDVEEILKAGTRATALTRQLLLFSRHQAIEFKVLDLNAIVMDMEKMLQRLIGEDLKLSVVCGPGLGRVKSDAGHIEQVVLNLAVNARDAMPRGGRLTIETANIDLDAQPNGIRGPVKPGRYVMLAVSDTGEGMTEEVRSHLFEPFFTTKGVGKGTGLGLSTVYGIVQAASGHVSVYSELGTGSTFKVYLPRVEEELAREHPPSQEVSLRRGSETILLVEDDEMVRELAFRILEMNGYQVIVAPNGGAALLACENHKGRIDMMLTDVVMPEMGGKELADRLARVRPGLRVLYFSGYTSGVVLHDDVVGSGSAFIQKPFTPQALAEKVREVLDAPGRGG